MLSSSALHTLAFLLRSTRLAALGTLREGAPFVSMVTYLAGEDLTKFYLHLSGLAVHTRALRADRRVGLLIAQTDPGIVDPQTLARVSIQGEAVGLPKGGAEFVAAQEGYLAQFPDSAQNFALADFDLYAIVPQSARFVAGFGHIFNLTLADFKRAGAIGRG